MYINQLEPGHKRKKNDPQVEKSNRILKLLLLTIFVIILTPFLVTSFSIQLKHV